MARGECRRRWGAAALTCLCLVASASGFEHRFPGWGAAHGQCGARACFHLPAGFLTRGVTRAGVLPRPARPQHHLVPLAMHAGGEGGIVRKSLHASWRKVSSEVQPQCAAAWELSGRAASLAGSAAASARDSAAAMVAAVAASAALLAALVVSFVDMVLSRSRAALAQAQGIPPAASGATAADGDRMQSDDSCGLDAAAAMRKEALHALAQPNEARSSWASPAGYVPGWASQMGDNTNIAPSKAAPSSWASPAGYVPGWASQMGDNTNIAPSARPKRWEPYGGYDPKNRKASEAPAVFGATVQAETRASSLADTLSSAPAKKWESYGGHGPTAEQLQAREMSNVAKRTIQNLLDESAAAPPQIGRRKKQQQKTDQKREESEEERRKKQQKAELLESGRADALEKYAMTLYRTVYAPAWQLPVADTAVSSSSAASAHAEHHIALMCIFLQVWCPKHSVCLCPCLLASSCTPRNK